MICFCGSYQPVYRAHGYVDNGYVYFVFPCCGRTVNCGKVKPSRENKTCGTRNKNTAAIATLERMGYTYHGGELWKPPLGKAPDFDLIDRIHARMEAAEARASQAEDNLITLFSVLNSLKSDMPDRINVTVTLG